MKSEQSGPSPIAIVIIVLLLLSIFDGSAKKVTEPKDGIRKVIEQPHETAQKTRNIPAGITAEQANMLMEDGSRTRVVVVDPGALRLVLSRLSDIQVLRKNVVTSTISYRNGGWHKKQSTATVICDELTKRAILFITLLVPLLGIAYLSVSATISMGNHLKLYATVLLLYIGMFVVMSISSVPIAIVGVVVVLTATYLGFESSLCTTGQQGLQAWMNSFMSIILCAIAMITAFITRDHKDSRLLCLVFISMEIVVLIGVTWIVNLIKAICNQVATRRTRATDAMA